VRDAQDQRPAFARADEARSAIAHVITQVRSAELDLRGAFELADSDELAGRCFAVKVFEVLPEVGKVRARRTMEEVGLAEDIWLKDVPTAKRNEIAAALSRVS